MILKRNKKACGREGEKENRETILEKGRKNHPTHTNSCRTQK